MAGRPPAPDVVETFTGRSRTCRRDVRGGSYGRFDAPAAVRPDPANPRGNNVYGHIVGIAEDASGSSWTSVAWDVFAFAGGPGYQPEGRHVPRCLMSLGLRLGSSATGRRHR